VVLAEGAELMVVVLTFNGSQVYVAAPDAVSVAVFPAQMLGDSGVTVMTGTGLSRGLTVYVDIHPFVLWEETE
jgi:hypothetical protein